MAAAGTLATDGGAMTKRIGLWRPAVLRVAGLLAAILLRLVLPVAIVAALTYGLVRFVQHEASGLVAGEMAATAKAAIAAAEAPIRQATDLLSEYARANENGCKALAAATGKLGERRTITGLALTDQTGRVMCSTSLSQSLPPMEGQLLTHVTARMPTVTIQPDPRPEVGAMLVAWGLRDGTRLVASLDPALPDLPAGPALAEGRLAVAVSLTDGRLWRASEAMGGSSSRILARASSETFPLVAVASVDADLVPRPFRTIATVLMGLGATVAGVILLTGGAGVWRRRPELRSGGRTRELPPLRYRPVVRMDDGKVIGFDLAIDPAPGEPEGLAGPAILAAALGETAPLLQDRRGLKLSIGVDIEGADFPELLSVLCGALARLSISPEQIVLRLSPDGFGQPQVNERVAELRSTGCLVALDRFAAGKGGLITLVRQRPDFLSIDGGLVAEVEESEEVTALVAAVVTMARSLRIGVVAHGIGSQAEVAALRRVGITSGTGPVFGAPLDAALAAALVGAAAMPGKVPETMAA